ncbi:hypothetical protein OV203_26030 [Nannocystis sp. ILAH1]|uniref:hypothetical protein n=1 Tax=Nannocystis sp. ILAH1 TaxID=2996789 RepID=UPI002270F75C|nr:hypothetical protein [Nannocystis sp. ILAH1]MCY0990629.1 hypothetical protein [Nannocystis sp. ILAH1]
MNTITTTQLRDAFRDAILAIVPTFEPLSSIRWSYCPSKRKGGRAQLQGLGTRSFDIMIRGGRPGHTWVGGHGESYVASLAIATAYCDIEPEILDHLLLADAVDLRKALYMLRDPVLSGFVGFGTGDEFVIRNELVDDNANVYLEFTNMIWWNQATDTY